MWLILFPAIDTLSELRTLTSMNSICSWLAKSKVIHRLVVGTNRHAAPPLSVRIHVHSTIYSLISLLQVDELATVGKSGVSWVVDKLVGVHQGTGGLPDQEV